MRLALRLTRCGALLALLLTSTAVVAQDGDWDYSTASDGTTQARVDFDSGVMIAVQCRADQLMVAVGGVPGQTGASRNVVVTRSDGHSRKLTLTAVANTPLLTSQDPADARFLRAPGPITIMSSSDDVHPFKMSLESPAESSRVDDVLTACGYSTARDRDGLQDVSKYLIDLQPLEMPAMPRRYDLVSVELSCFVVQSRLKECRSDRETPRAPQIGAAAARLANGRRVKLAADAPVDGILHVVVTGNRVRNRIGR